MVEVLLVLAIVALAIIGGCIAVVALVVHTLHARNRVRPDRRSQAPLTWLVAPELAPRLHRRLRTAVMLLDAAVGLVVAPAGSPAADLGLVDVAAQLRDRAAELDDQLVLASRAPKSGRRRMLRELQSEVAELERLAERTVRMSRAWRGAAPSERGLAEVRERLELLEGALRELDGVEVHTPLRVSDPVLRRHPHAPR
jgi:hypothetical protein